MTIEPNSPVMATCQLVSGSKSSLIRIWSGETLETLTVLKDNQTLNQPVIDMQFTVNVSKTKIKIKPSQTILIIERIVCGERKWHCPQHQFVELA